METLNENEVDKQFEMFEKTFSSEDSEKARQLIQYISRQMNDRSLRGYIEHEFDTLIKNSAKGIFYITFLQQITFPEEKEKLPLDKQNTYSFDKELITAKTTCKSSFNLLYLLATRVQKGRDYDLIGREIESRKPLLVSQK